MQGDGDGVGRTGSERGLEGLMASLRPAAARSADHYADGWWRKETFVDDLRATASSDPGRTVFINWRRDLGHEVVVTYGELAEHVRRLSAGLRGLGLRRGDAVAFQFPNWWEAAALLLACMDAGLVAVPVLITLGGREVERVLSGTGARACVVLDEWEGARPDRMLAGLDARLPRLEHRIVFGDAAATGAVAFADLLAHDPSASDEGSPRGPDELSIVLFTSGTTGEMKGVLHTANTQYASLRAMRVNDGPERRLASMANLIHGAAMLINILRPITDGRSSVFADTRDADVWLGLLARHRITFLLGSPPGLRSLVEAQQRERRSLPALETVTSTGAPFPAAYVEPVREWLCERLRNTYGMTEIGFFSATAPDDPPELAGRSIGRPAPGFASRLVPDESSDGGDVFRLHVRGPSVCLGTFRLSDRRIAWDPADTGGWYDTGDLVREDGHGGLQYLFRVADRIGSPLPIPVLEVEDELLRHPSVADVAIVGFPDPDDGTETVCAVVVADGEAPTLESLRRHLLETGMTEWYLPTRLEQVDVLPRNHMGKVLKHRLRDRFLGRE
ncbi:AMP-binding protein [Spirillospora sp. NPDC052269]